MTTSVSVETLGTVRVTMESKQRTAGLVTVGASAVPVLRVRATGRSEGWESISQRSGIVGWK